jgi:unsaturated chondroitin disaccharide hydrolase
MPERTEAEALSLLVDRVGTTLDSTGDAFPYHADPDTGEWTTTADGNWCGGHWAHMLWMAFDRTGEERFREAARAHAETMDTALPQNTMFRGMNCLHAGFEAHDISGDDRERDLGIAGADAMRAAYHERARQIPIGVLPVEVPDWVTEFRGPENEVTGEESGATDSIHAAVPVCWRAYEETGDPTYRDVAISHADRHLDWYIKPDGSTWNIVQFDPETGEFVRGFNDLAYSDETCWARGQGWTVAGLADAYRATAGERYRYALERVVDYYLDHAPADRIPHWDFEHPDKPDVPRDTSAAAIAAHGLARLPNREPTARLRAVGEEIVGSLIADYLTPLGPDDDRPNGMVLHGCYNGPAGYATDDELLWTDYYLMATLYERVAGDAPR